MTNKALATYSYAGRASAYGAASQVPIRGEIIGRRIVLGRVSETTELQPRPQRARTVAPDRDTYDGTVRLSDYLAVLREHRWLIGCVALLGLAAGTAAAFLIRPVYRAEVEFAPAQDDQGRSPLSMLAGQLGSLGTIAGLQAEGGGSKDQAIATLKSRTFTNMFIREQNLMPILFADDWDAENERWIADDPADQPSKWDAIELFDTEVRSVVENPANGLITLRIQWTDRELAAAWANRLIERLNEHLRQRAIADGRKSIEYLNSELGKTSVYEVRQSIYRLIETQINGIMLANVQKEFAFEIIDPAIVPDADEYVWPNRPLLIGAGLVFGLLSGFVLAVLLNAWRRPADGS